MLTNAVSIAPDGDRNFGPRHLDFHPTKPWMYVSIETQNKMYTYKMEAGRINPEIADADPAHRDPRHPSAHVSRSISRIWSSVLAATRGGIATLGFC